jgi:hypothetical protein
MATNKSARHTPAAPRMAGMSRANAPSSSRQPVMVTICRRNGNAAGTMRMRSSFVFVKCTLAVSSSRSASA